MPLLARRERSRDGEIIHVEGSIDETADLAALFNDVPANAVFNLAKIKRINSIGINRWIPLVQATAKSRSVSFAELPYCVVMQANCLSNLFGGAPVESVLAPYYCSKCEVSSDVVVSRSEAKAAHPEVPEKKCATCQGALALDEIDTYFQCLL